MKRLLLIVALVLVSLPAAAQTSVTFDHSDFATANYYEGGYFSLTVKADHTCDFAATPASSPMATLDNLGKPVTTTGVGMTAPLVSHPIGCYVYKVRVLDLSGLYSAWSVPSDPFADLPAAPGKPVRK